MIPYEIGSDTSMAAAHAMPAAQARSDEAVILDLVRLHPEGLTDDDLEVATGHKHQTISARRKGLVDKGLVCDSGRRRPTRSGREAVVWVQGAGNPIHGSPNKRVSRPSSDEIAAAETQIGTALDLAELHESDEMKKLRAWLRSLSG